MKQLKKIKGKAIAHAGSTDEVEDHYPAGNPADIPNGVVICKIHGCRFVNGCCPKRESPQLLAAIADRKKQQEQPEE